ncbi:MAG: hypothetical protein H0V09_08315 [Gemmatimonadetes bacterium]|nr:hypothetical protein [Gemmatimonadota bacterium]
MPPQGAGVGAAMGATGGATNLIAGAGAVPASALVDQDEVRRESKPDSKSAKGVCPKCGGRFLVGEMEGPTLMIDGVARDDFQPLLSARECSDCGYLEFYTRPAPA